MFCHSATIETDDRFRVNIENHVQLKFDEKRKQDEEMSLISEFPYDRDLVSIKFDRRKSGESNCDVRQKKHVEKSKREDRFSSIVEKNKVS